MPPARSERSYGRKSLGAGAESIADFGQLAALSGRTFSKTRCRTKVTGRLPGETSCLSLVWAVLDRAAPGWRGLTMTADRLRHLRRSLLDPPCQLRTRTITTTRTTTGTRRPEAHADTGL